MGELRNRSDSLPFVSRLLRWFEGCRGRRCRPGDGEWRRDGDRQQLGHDGGDGDGWAGEDAQAAGGDMQLVQSEVAVPAKGRIPKWCGTSWRHRAWEQKRAAESGRSAVAVVERIVERVVTA